MIWHEIVRRAFSVGVENFTFLKCCRSARLKLRLGAAAECKEPVLLAWSAPCQRVGAAR